MTAAAKPERRLGLIGYADVMRLIQRAPKTSADLSRRLNWEERRMSMNLRLWQRFGIVHCVGWVSPGYGRARAEVWKFGPGESVPRPEGLTRELIRPHAMRSRAHSFSIIVGELLHGATIDEATEVSGVTRRIVAELLVEMHRLQLLHVSAWTRRSCGGEPVPTYKVGRLRDAERPSPLGNREAAKKWRKNNRFRKIGAVLQSMALAQHSDSR